MQSIVGASVSSNAVQLPDFDIGYRVFAAIWRLSLRQSERCVRLALSLALRTLSRSSLCSAVSEVRRALSLSLLRCSLSSLFPDDSGTLAEELLYDSIVEHMASALYVFYRCYVR